MSAAKPKREHPFDALAFGLSDRLARLIDPLTQREFTLLMVGVSIATIALLVTYR